jgi:F-type H+-transporting ATPase subunit b
VLKTLSLPAILTLAASLANPALAADAAGGHKTQGLIAGVEQGLVSTVVTLVVFSIAFGILAVAVWPKILKGLKDRENKIREEIESAEMARQQAKDALEQYQNSLAQARAEAAKMLETTRAQQAALAADLKAKADVELSQMRERAMRDIESAKRAAVSEIYAMTGTLVNDVAGKILRRNVNTDDTNRLVEESMGQLQSLSR